MVAEAVRGGVGQLWYSARRMPLQFADRAALYGWRDAAGLSRQDAYAALTAMTGEAPLTRLLPPATDRA